MTLRCGRLWLYVIVLALAITPTTIFAGGPPSADIARPQDRGPQTPQNMAPPPAATSAESQGFGISGGIGLASVAGGIGTSPQLNLAYTGERQFAWYTRVYSPWLSFGGMMDGRVSGELLWFKFKGPDTYTGAPVPATPSSIALNQGDRIEATLDAHYWRLNGDLGVNAGNLGGVGAFRFGPRFQYFIYSDLYRIQNFTVVGKSEEQRNYSMPGIGLFASLDLGNLSPGAASFNPRLNLAGTYGKGNGMRYNAWEVVAEVLLGAGMGGYSSLPLPGVLLQAGYIFINIVETEEHFELLTSGALRTDRADYQVQYPLVKASISF